MNKRQSRLFAIGCTVFAAVLFLGMTVDTHRQLPSLQPEITPEVTRGKDVWHANNCINCHTLFGEGAYYAPDLTKITQQRGEPYLRAFIKDPSQFYDEQRHRRLMPKQNLSDEDISALIAFLGWVSNVDNQGWPPRPIVVTGSGSPAMAVARDEARTGSPRAVTSESNPIAIGENLFRTVQPSCVACHSIQHGVQMAGPSLAGVAEHAKAQMADPAYKGQAKDVESFLRESITKPSAFLVPGPQFSADGVSFMPDTYGKDLTPEQIDQIVAYLMSLR